MMALLSRWIVSLALLLVAITVVTVFLSTDMLLEQQYVYLYTIYSTTQVLQQ